MKKPFQVGERVVVYGSSQTGIKQAGAGRRGAIIGICEGGSHWVNVKFDWDREDYTFHIKQCRRLAKKKRREWWVWVDSNSGKWTIGFDRPPGKGAIRVREVREKK